jgi:predicted amino acid dehydrogenase
MKWNIAAAALFLALATTPTTTDAFVVSSAQVSSRYNNRKQNQASVFVSSNQRSSITSRLTSAKSSSSSLQMSSSSYTVGIVGATGAVGKEIRQCLETRNFPVSKLRIFGSSRSAGTVQETNRGAVTIELFDLQTARECDVVFLAVSGDFSLEHAEALVAGDDGCIVIDNSVRETTLRFEKEMNRCSTVHQD